MAGKDEMNHRSSWLKGKTFREKLGYFWDYYKVHTIVAALFLFIAGIFVRDSLNAKDYAFCATMLNSYAMEQQEAFSEDFAAYAGIDLDTYDCSIDMTSTLSYDTMSQMDLAVSQRIVAMSQIGEIDVLVSDPEPFANFALGGLFQDLKKTLTEEEYAQFQAQFFYIDRASLDTDGNDMNYDENGEPQIVDTSIDHSDPSLMKDPIPVGIYVSDAPKLKESGCYKNGGEAVLGFAWSSERPEMARRFLAYLYEEG